MRVCYWHISGLCECLNEETFLCERVWLLWYISKQLEKVFD